MITVNPRWSERRLPKFFLDWRSGWKTTSQAGMSISDYLDIQNALPFVIAGAWLFCPETVEYRGCLFLTDRFSPDNVDTWFEQLNGSMVGVQAKVNQTRLWDSFANSDLDRYGGDLDQLALAIGECWQGVLSTRYPGRVITVETSGDDDGGYGPAVTFWSEKR